MNQTINQNYQNLVDKLSEISYLNGVMSTLGWDQEVMMPVGATEARAQQISVLAGVIHERMTDPRLGDILAALEAEKSSGFNAMQLCNIREARRNFDLETRLPKKLVKAMAQLSSQGHAVWAAARQHNKFSDFAPVLKHFLELKKEWAHCVYPELHPYDANIDNFERGTTMAEITPIFDRLKDELIPLIQIIHDRQYQPAVSFLQGKFPVAKQEALARKISKDIGFQFDYGRMDVSIHPFCGGSHPTDVRITTRYKESDFIESLFAVIHETGHALYEQGRMKEGRDLPVSEALTMGIHESQSLFWERMVAQSKPFCTHYLGDIQTAFPNNMQGVTADSLYRAINSCKPDFIRVEADELTYPLHIILRYEIEKGLFDDTIAINDLPEAWNTKMKQYLGITPPTDTLGVLQDSHWSSGAFGYFPSYTLGAIYACQFYNALTNEMQDIEEEIATGNFAVIKAWLNEKIHCQGRLYSPQDLLKRVTGESLNPDHFIGYLKRKYSEIYQFDPGDVNK